jgi:hypothetical protein
MKHAWKTWLLFGVPTAGLVVTLGLLLDCRRELQAEHERLLRVADLLETWSTLGRIERNPDGTLPTDGGRLKWLRVTENWSPRAPGAEYYVLSARVPWPQRRERLQERYSTELTERGHVTATVEADGRLSRLFFDKP